MITLLLKYAKRVLTLLIVAFLLTTTVVAAKTNEYINYKVGTQVEQSIETEVPAWAQRQAQIIIRCGEYQNKPGKRVYLNDIGLHFKDIPTDIKIHKDNNGAYIQEYDLNKKISTRIYEELLKRGVKVVYQDTKDRTEDLNRAGRIANKVNPNIYFSVHTNYYNSKSKGFFIMSNEGNRTARNIADRLSSSIENNGMIQRREPLLNNGQIGEMNEINNSTIALLLEAGFYSNPNELKYLMSNEYVNYIAEHLADELSNVLDNYWE